MIAQLLVLNTRGDTIIYRDFRGGRSLGENLGKIQDLFYKNIKLGQTEEPTVICFEDQIYFYLRQGSLYFVLTSQYDVSPAYMMELLCRIMKLVRDFCGVVNEDSIRRNFILVYEIVDEVIDFGYPQIVSTDQLKYCIYNDTKILSCENHFRKNEIFAAGNLLGLTNTVSGGLSILPMGIFPPPNGNSSSGGGISGGNSNNFSGPKTISSNASQRPINPVTTISHNSTESKVMAFLGSTAQNLERNNEVFVDIFERVSLVLSHRGEVSRFNIEGGILMKSYLIGRPELTLGFTNEIILKEDENFESLESKMIRDAQYTFIDDCNFHESVDVNEFLENKTITLRPPEGEMIVMNYRISKGSLRVPFKLFATLEAPCGPRKQSSRFNLMIRLKADIPESSFATNLTLVCPLPSKTTSISLETIHPTIPIQQSSHYDEKSQKITWKIKKIQGGTETALKSIVSLSVESFPERVKRLMGPIYLNFEIPMFNLSNIQVKYLRISDGYGQQNNYRWVRYVTQSNSYIYRLF
ncbi:putative coatomer protein complex, gamma sub-unit [Cryptosporidium felis]|nr:putative coatomer protein complex, gamma sub-unit [Cryptosporidium felis]